MPWKVLTGLILCNFIWSANPTWGKVILGVVSPEMTAWLRYVSSLGAYLFAVALFQLFPRFFSGLRSHMEGPYFMRPQNLREWGLLFSLGFMTFCFSPFLQFSGLSASRATDNALIVALEPLITVGLAWIFLKERLSRKFVICLIFALIGFMMLAVPNLEQVGLAQLSALVDAHFIGNLLILGALLGEACFSIFSRKLQVRHAPLGIFGSALWMGVGSLSVVVLIKSGPHIFLELARLNVKSLAALICLGPIGTALTYFFWMLVLKRASVSSMALTLFVQPIAGSILGYAFLDERLTVLQLMGGILIAVSVLIQSVNSS